MTKAAAAALIAIACLGPAVSSADEAAELRDELEPLHFLAGSCWAGTFPDGKRVDTHCYSPMLGGMHLRGRNTVTGGPSPYAGETIYSWNADAGEIRYVYLNSLGGVSTGAAHAESGRMVFPDEIYDGPDGEKISVSSFWENITAEGYDAVITESRPGRAATEIRIRYERRPFAEPDAR